MRGRLVVVALDALPASLLERFSGNDAKTRVLALLGLLSRLCKETEGTSAPAEDAR